MNKLLNYKILVTTSLLKICYAILNSTETSKFTTAKYYLSIKPLPHQFIVGGTSAKLGEFPWQGLLSLLANDGKGYLCGATLISSNYAMTAGHCATGMKADDSFVQFGIIDAYSLDNVYGIKEFIRHPNYVGIEGKTANDIAVLKLEKEVKFTNFILPISLPINDTNLREINGSVSGWGHTIVGNQSSLDTSRYLMQTDIPFIDQQTCRNSYLGVRIDDGMVCAGGIMQGTAPGDSGGPLHVEYNNSWFQVGITSFGIDTPQGLIDQKDNPGVYTRVSYYCDFIYNATNGEAECTNHGTEIRYKWDLTPAPSVGSSLNGDSDSASKTFQKLTTFLIIIFVNYLNMNKS